MCHLVRLLNFFKPTSIPLLAIQRAQATKLTFFESFFLMKIFVGKLSRSLFLFVHRHHNEMSQVLLQTLNPA